MSEEEPKIIIDEGWKAQVQREKEEAERKAAEQPAPESDASAPAGESTPVPADNEGEGAPDEDAASFTALVGSLATQIMYALGLVGDPNGGQVMVNLDAARYTLDVLGILEEKTQGNLNDEETEMLGQTRSELEQVFAVRVQQFQEQAMKESGVNLDNIKGE